VYTKKRNYATKQATCKKKRGRPPRRPPGKTRASCTRIPYLQSLAGALADVPPLPFSGERRSYHQGIYRVRKMMTEAITTPDPTPSPEYKHDSPALLYRVLYLINRPRNTKMRLNTPRPKRRRSRGRWYSKKADKISPTSIP